MGSSVTTDQALAPIAERARPPAEVRVPSGAHGLTWRPLTPDDGAGLTTLVTAIEEADSEPFRTSYDEVMEKFEGAWKDHARDTLAGVDDSGVLRAWAQVNQPPGDVSVVRTYLDGGVHPEWRARGIGRELLAWQVDRARQVLAATGKDVPGRIAAFASEQATATIALLQAAGLAPIRVYSELRRPLGEDLPERVPPSGVRIAPWSDERDEDVRLAHNEAFASHWGSEPQTGESWRSGRSQFAPDWSLVALDEESDEVAGYLLSGRYEQDWEIAGHSSGYVELLGVRPGWRRRGVAPALLAAVMARLRADGIEYAEIGVDTENLSGALGLYTSLGFAPFHRATMYTIEL
jgi:mycothiol synthase